MRANGHEFSFLSPLALYVAREEAKIIAHLRAQGRESAGRRRMIGNEENAPVSFNHLSASISDFRNAKNGPGCDFAKKTDDTRIDQPQLSLQVRIAGVDADSTGFAFKNRNTFDGGSYEYVLASDAGVMEHLVEKAAGRTDERVAGYVLLFSRGLPYKHCRGVERSLARNCSIARFPEEAPATMPHLRMEFFEFRQTIFIRCFHILAHSRADSSSSSLRLLCDYWQRGATSATTAVGEIRAGDAHERSLDDGLAALGAARVCALGIMHVSHVYVAKPFALAYPGGAFEGLDGGRDGVERLIIGMKARYVPWQIG